MYYDTPVVHLGIDNKDKVNGSSLNKKFFFSDHYQYIMRRKASFFVKNFSELLEAINKYFENPNLLRNERLDVVKEQIFYLDGKAADRIVDIISPFAV